MPGELPLTEEEKRIGELVRAVMGDRQFKPFAIYRGDMDRIEVLVRDCSVCEIYVGLITLFEDQYPEDGEDKLVGFAIESAKAFCRVHGLSTIRVDLANILDLLGMAVGIRSVDFEKLLGQLDDTVVVLSNS